MVRRAAYPALVADADDFGMDSDGAVGGDANVGDVMGERMLGRVTPEVGDGGVADDDAVDGRPNPTSTYRASAVNNSCVRENWRSSIRFP